MANKSAKAIRKIFSETPRTYELINHILTLGLDIFWRRKAAEISAGFGGRRWLDVCSGTGEMAGYLRRFAKDGTEIIASDFCFPMIREALKKPEANRISFCISEASALPFRDDTFDLITISFATRNIYSDRKMLLSCFHEFRRILKPGGRFVNLETSQPSSKFLRRFFHLYVRLIVGPLGYMISGSKAAYFYLSQTIPRFFGGVELSELIYQAGFAEVNQLRMTYGISAMHMAVK